MKKILIFIGITVFLLAILYSAIKNVYHIDEKALVSLVKPPSEDIIRLPQGSDLDSPLNIPEGFRLAVFAKLKSSPRVLAVDPGGVVLASVPEDGKVIALPDMDEDGIADTVSDVASGLDDPHGIEFFEGKLYVAETGSVSRYDYDQDKFVAQNRQELFGLPSGGRHWSRTIRIHNGKLYTSVGSSCDVCREKDDKRSAILVSNLDGSDLKLFASGLRNTVFFDFDSQGRMWGNDMGRDFLGDNLPPDELNIIEAGKDYGWPFCYGKNVRDHKFDSGNTINCAESQRSTYDYPAHIAPLGVRFINSKMFSEDSQGDLLSVFHGSWNSSTPVGYKIVKLDVSGKKVSEMADFISGWLKKGGDVLGRPVDLIFDNEGYLYISDDKANIVYILSRETN